MKPLISAALLLLLAACASAESQSYQYYLSNRGVPEPAAESFPHCHGYGCQFVQDITLSKKDWRKIEAVFKPASKSAVQERARIKKAIALFEQKVGAQAGTGDDIRGTFIKTGHYQLDCVDESTNTTIYLVTLKNKGLIRYHEIEAPSVRLPIIGGGGWVHQTAAIHETESGERFAVDSWFHDNGIPAEVVALRDWTYGWRPVIPPKPGQKPLIQLAYEEN